MTNDGKDGPKVRPVTEPFEHSDAVTWDSKVGLLYFADVYKGRIYNYNIRTRATYHAELPQPVAVIVPAKGDNYRFAVSQNRTLLEVVWDRKGPIGEHWELSAISDEFGASEINGGKADSRGRIWFGTQGPESPLGIVPHEGALYMLDNADSPHPTKKVSPVTKSGGMAWNKNNDRLYFIDAATYKIAEYVFDEETGGIYSPRVVADFRRLFGLYAVPGGLTVDVDDKLWVSLFGGGAVVRVDPENGKVLQTVAIPASYVTSIAWGGNKLDVLYAATSKLRLMEAQRKRQPNAGCVFAVTNLGTKGVPAYGADVFAEAVEAISEDEEVEEDV